MFLKSLATALAASLAAVTLAAACGGGTVAGREKVVLVEGDAFQGQADAKVTLIEYGSPTCPVCKDWHDAYWAEVKRDYIDTGKIKFVFREFAVHGAIDGAIFSVARCAGKEDFFGVIDEAFANQNKLVAAANSGDAMPELRALGAKFNLSEAQVNTCVDEPANIRRVNDVGTDALQKGINGTPTFVVNGVKIADSAWPAVKIAVDAALAGGDVPAQPAAPAGDDHEHAPGESH
jgi:protein-disulfide isomerase